MGIDKTQATDLWQQVLLFRRLFHDIANGSLIAPELFHNYSNWANASVTGLTYTLPQSLHFSGVQDLADFELYLAETGAPATGIEIPSKALSVDAVQKKSPELVEKRALAKVKRADKKALEAKVSLKETLEWEEKPENFALLKKTFPDLGVKEGATSEDRVAALDTLPDRTRAKVDSFAREQIVASRTDWIKQALGQTEFQEQVLSIRSKGGKDPLPGASDRLALLKALESNGKGKPFEYTTADGVYEIELIDISPSWEIVSFEEARKQGILSELLLAKLTPYYQEIRDKHSDQFRSADGTWKPIAEAKQAVLEYYLEPKFDLIRKETETNIKENSTPLLIASTLPSYRFVGWASKVRSAKDKTPYVYEQPAYAAEEGKLAKKEAWADQFKWRVSERSFPRGTGEDGQQDFLPGKEKLFALKSGEFSELMTPSNGDIQFVEVGSHAGLVVDKEVEEAVLGVRALLGGEAQRNYMKALLNEIKAKNGISFDWLNVADQASPSINP
jgi:hypothetical protein